MSRRFERGSEEFITTGIIQLRGRKKDQCEQSEEFVEGESSIGDGDGTKASRLCIG